MSVRTSSFRVHLFLAISLLAGLCLAHELLSATPERVYIAGHEFVYQCHVKRLTGLPCPGCGGTRSFVLALHGDFGAALRLNPVGIIVLAGIILFGLSQIILLVADFGYGRNVADFLRRAAEPKYIAYASYGLVAVALGQWLLKLFML